MYDYQHNIPLLIQNQIQTNYQYIQTTLNSTFFSGRKFCSSVGYIIELQCRGGCFFRPLISKKSQIFRRKQFDAPGETSRSSPEFVNITKIQQKQYCSHTVSSKQNRISSNFACQMKGILISEPTCFLLSNYHSATKYLRMLPFLLYLLYLGYNIIAGFTNFMTVQ